MSDSNMYQINIAYGGTLHVWTVQNLDDAKEAAQRFAESGFFIRQRSGRLKLVLPRNIKSIPIIPTKG